MNFVFFLNSILLGTGLAMDAFSVSIANGLNEPRMSAPRMSAIAGVYAGFQFFMPMAGWFCVHTIENQFRVVQKWIPLIALVLLLFIGGEMLLDGIRGRSLEEDVLGESAGRLSVRNLLLQGVATSIDALSVGFTISEYGGGMAFICCLIIAVVTFAICVCGLVFGKHFGNRFSEKAACVGGIILIAIGVEIFIKGYF